MRQKGELAEVKTPPGSDMSENTLCVPRENSPLLEKQVHGILAERISKLDQVCILDADNQKSNKTWLSCTLAAGESIGP
jgi:hypothetical protein